jgi:hypothetical protein
MTHPLFRSDVFVETAFEHRFQAMLRSALHKRSWHVIVADPGSGKTMGIREMVQTTGSPVILAVTAPKNDDDEQALGDQLEPFCRIVGHTSEEVREILAALETVYRELFPQLNLRQWSGAIYTWLTQPVLDPTNSGRVTMDYLMKLVTTALEWSFEASETNVRAETLEKAAELLILRRDTLRIIDGAGPVSDATQSDSTGQDQVSETEGEGVSERAKPEDITAQAHTSQTDNEDQTSSTRSKPAASHDAVMDQKHPVKPPKCMFSAVVPIELKRFLDSGIGRVECPDCACMRTLKPQGGVLRFKSHDKRKTRTPNTDQRWARRETSWEVVGGEST